VDEKYNRYLCGREWSLKKRAVKARCNGVCERCQDNPMHHVHHLTYARKYNERLDDLQGLCKGCHDFIHAFSDFDPKDFADKQKAAAAQADERQKLEQRALRRRKKRNIRKFSRSAWERFIWLRTDDARMSEEDSMDAILACMNFARWRSGIAITGKESRFDYIWKNEFCGKQGAVA
jgi:hypothetical protein